MKHSKLFSILVILTLAIYAIIGFYFLPLSSFEGDLTRLAKLPESEFGWTKPQPTITAELLRQSTWQEADVLVVGDSFSKPHLWQTVLTQQGLQVRTEDWRNIRAICEDFSPWLKSQGFNGKFVIFEMVERGAEDVLDRSVSCNKMSYRPSPYSQPSPPETLPDRQLRSYTGKLSIGIQTWLHSLQYTYLDNSPDFKQWELPNHVKMQRLSNGCDLFSHPRCQDVLFLTEDRIQDFNETMLDNMGTINSNLSGFKPVWVIVPDKSTAYFNFNKQFWNRAEQRFHAPNLLHSFRKEIENKTTDFYRGNDTHLSTNGFLIMGENIRQSMLAYDIKGGTLAPN
jgi:hypothetical protein